MGGDRKCIPICQQCAPAFADLRAKLAACEKERDAANVAAAWLIEGTLTDKSVTPDMRETIDEFLEAGRASYAAAWRRHDALEARNASLVALLAETTAREAELKAATERADVCREMCQVPRLRMCECLMVEHGKSWFSLTSLAREAIERAQAAEKMAGELRDAMREILVGKIVEDNRHPMGEWFSMASRFLDIAKSALARTKPGST